MLRMEPDKQKQTTTENSVKCSKEVQVLPLASVAPRTCQSQVLLSDFGSNHAVHSALYCSVETLNLKMSSTIQCTQHTAQELAVGKETYNFKLPCFCSLQSNAEQA